MIPKISQAIKPRLSKHGDKLWKCEGLGCSVVSTTPEKTYLAWVNLAISQKRKFGHESHCCG